jgi:hypothetical protein
MMAERKETADKDLRRLALAIALMCAPALGLAQAREATVWIPLDPSKPEHAAILGWHRALVANDYAAYIRYREPLAGISEANQRAYFASVRSMTPSKLMIAASPSHINPNGTKTYTVAGCMKQPGDPEEMRMVAGVTPYQNNGRWRVSGSDFGPPWNKTLRECPVK